MKLGHILTSISLVIVFTTFTPSVSSQQKLLDQFAKDCKKSDATDACFVFNEDQVGHGKDKFDCKTCSMALVSYASANKLFKVRMRAKLGDNKYFGVGFSNDNSMGNDLVAHCIKKVGVITVGLSKTDGNKGSFIMSQQSNEMSRADIDGITYCELTIPGKSGAFDLIVNKYYLLYAIGDTAGAADNSIGAYHLNQKGATDQTQNFTHTLDNIVASAPQTGQAKAIIHEIGMILAFTFFMPAGMFIGRYYKETWAKQHFCHRRKWVSFHVILLLSAVVSALIAVMTQIIDNEPNFIIPLMEISPYYTHVVVGSCSMALLLYTSTTHWFHSDKGWLRKLLSVIHSCAAVLCYILGNVNLIMSTEWTRRTQNGKYPPVCGEKRTWVGVQIAIYACFHLIMASYISWTDWHLDIHGCRSFTTIPLQIMTNEEAPRPKLRKIILYIYLGISAVGTTIILIYYLDLVKCV